MSGRGSGTSSALATWRALPEERLRAAGPASRMLVEAGCADFRAAGRQLLLLPYGRNRDRSDWRLVLREGRGTCSTKHALLAAAAGEVGLPIQLTVGLYGMNERNTPGVGAVLAAHDLTAIPEAHCYVVWQGQRIDVTRSGVEATEPIASFEVEWPIEPDQIGAHKVALHRRHVATWLAGAGRPDLSVDALWSIREACIAALAQTAG